MTTTTPEASGKPLEDITAGNTAFLALAEEAARAGQSIQEFLAAMGGEVQVKNRYVENRAERRKREQAERRASR